MFYEGTEKRLLVCVQGVDLLTLPKHFWQQLVHQADATILSHISNANIQAYLLSESSLFVWQNKLLLVTCGNTKLIKAVSFLQQYLAKPQIQTLLFQRHQAIKPQLQHTSFEQDSLILKESFNGQQRHWRDNYQGDLFLFGHISTTSINTKSIYMLHGLSGEFAEQLQQGSLQKQEILAHLQLSSFFNGLSIDHHQFQPKGYSVNAIKGEDYLTIHLTPEKLSTYLSIETSFPAQSCLAFIEHIKLILQPQCVKQMHFHIKQQQLDIEVY